MSGVIPPHRTIVACLALLILAPVWQQGAAASDTPAPAETDPVLARVDEAIGITSRRYLTANVHSPWQILHGILALRQDFELKAGDQKVNALEWIAEGQTFDGRPWVLATRHGGKFHPFTRPWAFEGHPNQFLAILTMSDLPESFAFQAGNRTVTIGDMVRNAQMEVNSREEITWTLWALAYYLDSDAQWVNQWGEPWSIERLVQIQTAATVERAACGGTHGLFALARARNAHVQSGRPITGVWVAAEQKINRYIEIARALQNQDGTFSADYFRSRQYSRDFTRRITTSGHILEFVMMALPQHRLKEEWVRRAVYAVANDLIVHRKQDADCGPLYHALDALIIYRDRVRPVQLAVAEPVEDTPAAAEEPTTNQESPGKINSVDETSDIDKGEAGGTAPLPEPEPGETAAPVSAEAVARENREAPASALNPANLQSFPPARLPESDNARPLP